MEKCSVAKLGDIYLRATWVEQDLFLMIMSGAEAWRGELLEDQCRKLDEKFGDSIGSNFQMLAKEAFVAPSENHEISIEAGNLIWRKVGGKKKMKLTEIELSPVNFLDAQKEIFDYLLKTNMEVTSKNKEYARRQENLVAEMKKSRTMLRNFEKVKEEIEDRLYETFLPVLNSKKRKIRELEERLGDSHNTETRVSHGGEEYGSDTEEEKSEGEGGNEHAECEDTLVSKDKNDSLDLLEDSF